MASPPPTSSSAEPAPTPLAKLLTPAAKKTLSKVTKKASESSFQIGATCFGLILSVFCAYLTISMEGDGKNLVTTVCVTTFVDMVVSILYYMDQVPESAILFTEAGSNAFQVLLFLEQVGPVKTQDVMWVSLVSILTFPVQLKMKNDPTWWSRFLVYVPLFFSFAMHWSGLESHVRLRIFATCVDVALVLDVFDIPDSFSDVQLCDGLLVLLRSFGMYFLVSQSILRANGTTYFGFEQAVFNQLPQASKPASETVPPPASNNNTNATSAN